MKHLSLLSVAAVGLALFGLASVATAQTTFVSTRAGINANDTLDWSQLGALSSDHASPLSVTSTGGLGVTVTSSSFVQLIQQSTSSFHGDFAPGDYLVNALGPVTITFANAVTAAGLQIEAAGTGIPGTWTGTINAYDASNNLLGSFSGTDHATHNADNSALFLGVASTTENIKKITVSDPSTGSFGPQQTVEINQISIDTNAPAPVVPEGSSDLLMLSGLAVPATGYLFRRLRARK